MRCEQPASVPRHHFVQPSRRRRDDFLSPNPPCEVTHHRAPLARSSTWSPAPLRRRTHHDSTRRKSSKSPPCSSRGTGSSGNSSRPSGRGRSDGSGGYSSWERRLALPGRQRCRRRPHCPLGRFHRRRQMCGRMVRSAGYNVCHVCGTGTPDGLGRRVRRRVQQQFVDDYDRLPSPVPIYGLAEGKDARGGSNVSGNEVRRRTRRCDFMAAVEIEGFGDRKLMGTPPDAALDRTALLR